MSDAVTSTPAMPRRLCRTHRTRHLAVERDAHQRASRIVQLHRVSQLEFRFRACGDSARRYRRACVRLARRSDLLETPAEIPYGLLGLDQRRRNDQRCQRTPRTGAPRRDTPVRSQDFPS